MKVSIDKWTHNLLNAVHELGLIITDPSEFKQKFKLFGPRGHSIAKIKEEKKHWVHITFSFEA